MLLLLACLVNTDLYEQRKEDLALLPCDEPQTYYPDVDDDGFGDVASPQASCTPIAGFLDEGTDCDDEDPEVNPDALEICGNDRDDNCDLTVDEAPTWYLDSDDDGYGDPDVTTASCAQPSSYVFDARDCDDDDALIHPGAEERCNGLDDNCDTALSAVEEDEDDDGYMECDDCDDSREAVNPGETEVPDDALDNDCDGAVRRLEGNSPFGAFDSLNIERTSVGAPSFGAALALGDIDGDGAAELIIGDTASPGQVLVVDALVSLETDAQAVAAGRAHRLATGNSIGSGVQIRDVDGDGLADLSVTSGPDFRSYLYLGPVEENDGPDVSLTGPSDHWTTSTALGQLDGEPVLVNGARYSGSVTVGVLSDSTGILRVDWQDSLLGVPADEHGAALRLFDCDGSGLGCLAVGAPGQYETPGAVALYRDSGTFAAGDPDVEITDVGGRRIGAALSSGDLDHDGYEDLLIGAPGDDEVTGEGDIALVYTGPLSSGTRNLADAHASYDATGRAMVGAALAVADLDQDGTLDWIVGSNSEVVLFYGPLSPGARHVGDADLQMSHDSGFGSSLSDGADFAGDGTIDFAVGGGESTLNSVGLVQGHAL